MDEEVVARRVIEITKEFSGVTTIDITRDTTFEQLGFDTLDTIEYTLEIEEEFLVQIPDDEAMEARTVGDIVDAVLKKIVKRVKEIQETQERTRK